jgi:NADH-quinone oxidoreductase subunit A
MGFELFQVLLFGLVALVIALALLVVSTLVLSPRRADGELATPYECGFDPFGEAQTRFDVRFYLVSILFIIFDLEIMFLFPWAVVLREVGTLGYASVLLFLLVLTVGFVYEWRKGALDWE